jgi:hypothetical protein
MTNYKDAKYQYPASGITSGTLSVAKGGTNIASFTAGDVLYATGSTTLAKLPKGTAEQVLAMNAGATAPDWGSVDLTVLPTITVAKGGTNISSFAAGDILYATGATTLTKLVKGSAADVLTMNAGATAPEWAAAGGGGILQVKSAVKTDTMSTSSSSPTYLTGLTVSLTPASSSNKVLIHGLTTVGGYNNMYGALYCYRDIGGAGFSKLDDFVTDTLPGSMTEATVPANMQGEDHPLPFSYSFLDNPGTDSEVTYRTYGCRTDTWSTFWINRGGYTGNQVYNTGGICTITAYEIDSGAL